MKFIDTHAHLNFAAYDLDRQEVIKSLKKKNVAVINVGTQINTSIEAVQLADSNPDMYAIIGLHPIHVNKSFHDKEEIGPESSGFESRGEEFNPERYKDLIIHPKVVGVGECGLDHFRINGDVEKFKNRQEKAFRAQIEFALQHDKPIMIHCRDAYPEVLKIIKEYKDGTGYEGEYAGIAQGDKLRGNIHFFAGTCDDARQFLDLGFTISFTGVITFAPFYKELVEFVPLEKMHAETDCPYVAPKPFRGNRNEPIHVIEVAKKIAEIKRESLENVATQLQFNAKKLWGIDI